MNETMTDWREDGQAAYEYDLLMQAYDEWLRDEVAQAEYQRYKQEKRNEME